jgi:tRNA pseudouridine55 synthase
MTGFLNINKEKDFTSHDVVAVVRKTLSRVKTGHTGTLDPQARGVLPVCVGKATKLADYISEGDKAYTAEVVLGITTRTGDMTGEVLTRAGSGAFHFSPREIENAVKSFTGEILQTPPM